MGCFLVLVLFLLFERGACKLGSCPKVYQLFTHIVVRANTVFLQTLSPAAAKMQKDILLNILPVATCFCLLPLKKKMEFYHGAM